MKKMSNFFRLPILMILLFVSCDNKSITGPSGPEPMTSLDAITYLSSLKLGVNTGWWFSAYPHWESNVTSDNPFMNQVMNQAYMNGVASTGFDIVNLPVTWMPFIGDAPDYKVNKVRLQRVAEAVNMAKNAGLKIIINVNHDDGWMNGESFSDDGWLRIDKAAKSEEAKKEITAKFQAVWRQIAEYFKDYGDYLIFRSMGEPTDGNWSLPIAQASLDIVNEWNKVFVDTVRATGGNNSSRFLILPGYGADARFTIGNFILPPDSKNNVNKLIVSLHYYQPWDLTHTHIMQSWGTVSDKAAVDKSFNDMKKEYIDKGIAVILDEFGTLHNAAMENVHKEYISYVVGVSTELGIPALHHEDHADFIFFNRITGRLDPRMESYVQAMKNAVK